MLRFNPLLRGARVATTKKESSVLRRTGFNPLLRGARVATHRTVRTVRQLRVASIPYFAGHALQPARPVSRLPRTWRSPRFNPLLRGARVATHRRPTRCFNPLLRGARVATGCYFEDVSIKLTLQSPTSRGTRCNPPTSWARARRAWRFNPLLRGARVATARGAARA